MVVTSKKKDFVFYQIVKVYKGRHFIYVLFGLEHWTDFSGMSSKTSKGGIAFEVRRQRNADSIPRRNANSDQSKSHSLDFPCRSISKLVHVSSVTKFAKYFLYLVLN